MNENEFSANACADQSQPERSRHPIGAPTLQRAVSFKDESGSYRIRFYHTCGGWYEDLADEIAERFVGGNQGPIRDRLIKFYRSRVLFGRPSLGVEATNNLTYVYPGRSCFAWWSQQYD